MGSTVAARTVGATTSAESTAVHYKENIEHSKTTKSHFLLSNLKKQKKIEKIQNSKDEK